jgi:thioredoxin-like negative regulator of GroEL
MKAKQFRRALEVLEKFPERQRKLEAVCLEGMGELARAAAAYQEAGDLESALSCYRSIPDFPKTLALIRAMEAGHPAAPSLEWIARLQQTIAERPDNFTRVMKPAEKKLLETLLEQALGTRRHKPEGAQRPAPRKKPALRRMPRRSPQ